MGRYKDVEVEVEVELEDVLDFIEYASNYELQKIKEEFPNLRTDDDIEEYQILEVNNLYDREKVLILKEAMKRYNLDELMEKLGITQSDAM
jgi:hypothetical protein